MCKEILPILFRKVKIFSFFFLSVDIFPYRKSVCPFGHFYFGQFVNIFTLFGKSVLVLYICTLPFWECAINNYCFGLHISFSSYHFLMRFGNRLLPFSHFFSPSIYWLFWSCLFLVEHFFYVMSGLLIRVKISSHF